METTASGRSAQALHRERPPSREPLSVQRTSLYSQDDRGGDENTQDQRDAASGPHPSRQRTVLTDTHCRPARASTLTGARASRTSRLIAFANGRGASLPYCPGPTPDTIAHRRTMLRTHTCSRHRGGERPVQSHPLLLLAPDIGSIGPGGSVRRAPATAADTGRSSTSAPTSTGCSPSSYARRSPISAIDREDKLVVDG